MSQSTTEIRIVPRPGRLAVIPYALHPTAEIELHVLFQRGESPPRGLSALKLQLVSADGAVASQGRTEYEGALLLEGVRPGDYQLRIDPEQAARLHFRLKAPIHVTAPRGGGFVGRIDAIVIPDGGD